MKYLLTLYLLTFSLALFAGEGKEGMKLKADQQLARIEQLERSVRNLEQKLVDSKNKIQEDNLKQQTEILNNRNDFIEFKKGVFTSTQIWISLFSLLSFIGISAGLVYYKAKGVFYKELEFLFSTQKSVILALIEEKELLLKYYKKKKLLVISPTENSSTEIRRFIIENPDLSKFRKIEYKTISETDADLIGSADLIVLNNKSNELNNCVQFIDEHENQQFVYYNTTNNRITPSDNSNFGAANFPATLFEAIVKQLKLT
jgi:hypothetical protein